MPHKNREDYNKYMKEYTKKRYYRRRKRALEYLGNKCVMCGSSENLEFDHIIPEKKEYSIAKIISYKDAILFKELDKCQVLCKNCHLEKTKEDRSLKRHNRLKH